MRRNRSQAKLAAAFRFPRHELRLVRNGMRPIVADRLEQTEEYDRALSKPARERDLLAGIIGPFQIRIFHEKRFVVVPTGNLNAIKVGGWVLGGKNHSFLRRGWKQERGHHDVM